ncbi:MAG: hypothetical protein VX583_13105 [Bdellovibrionota bacterium]|nr:hypothetical protein [Pseudobdellovibrionaceae bacterium]|tara:strand:- start:93245 stop:93799 length:555 start_codon:yes stop_codon:yes gene_type:complete
MKMIMFLSALLLGAQLNAATINASFGSTYIGKEYVKQKRTGNSCVISIAHISEYSAKGNNCSKVSLMYYFHNQELNGYQQNGTVQSRITNYHTKEYKNGIKTCAEPILNEEGIKVEADIYGADTTYLYNPFFNGEAEKDGLELHYFLSLNAQDKTPTRAAINVVSSFSEELWECVDLVDATPAD